MSMFMSDRGRRRVAGCIRSKSPVNLAFALYSDTRKFGQDRKKCYTTDLKKTIESVSKIAKESGFTDEQILKFTNKIKELFKYLIPGDSDLEQWSNDYLLSQVDPKYRRRKPDLKEEKDKETFDTKGSKPNMDLFALLNDMFGLIKPDEVDK
jgi:hypothetical protein